MSTSLDAAAGPLRAGIYARKSTEQNASPIDKSVTRQIDGARAAAVADGCAVVEDFIFADDGISGVEFDRRPDFMRLMTAIRVKRGRRQRPPIDVLYLSEGSRLGRESIETAFAVKELKRAGIVVKSYLDGREIKLDNPMDKLLMQVGQIADEMESFRARQRTTDALLRRARAGRYCGGKVPYGYSATVTTDEHGHRSRVLRIDPVEAAIVLRIWTRAATGAGRSRIAKELNADRVPISRNNCGPYKVWTPPAIRAILDRPLYRGLFTYNRLKSSDDFGQHRVTTRPESEWITVPMPDLRIVPEAIAARVDAHKRRKSADPRFGARFDQKGRDGESKYLLVGFMRCGVCGGPIAAQAATAKHPAIYCCAERRRRGKDACTNRTQMPMDVLDRAVVDRLRALFTKETIGAIVSEAITPPATPAKVEAYRRELAKIDRELRNLNTAIAGGDFASTRTAIQEREVRRADLVDRIAAAPTAPQTVKDRRTWERTLDARIKDFRVMLDDIPSTREVLRIVLRGKPLRLFATGFRAVRFIGEPDLLSFVIAGLESPEIAPVQIRLSPRGQVRLYTVTLEGVAVGPKDGRAA